MLSAKEYNVKLTVTFLYSLGWKYKQDISVSSYNHPG